MNPEDVEPAIENQTDECVAVLGTATKQPSDLWNSATALQHLSLVKCEEVNDMKVLSNFKSLEYLNLDQCPLVNDDGDRWPW